MPKEAPGQWGCGRPRSIPYHPWESYIYLREWLVCMVNASYTDAMGIVKITIFVAPSLLKRDLWQTVSFIGSLLVGFVMCYLNIQILQSLRIETHPRVWTDRKCLGENAGSGALFSCICYPGSKKVLYLWFVDDRWHHFFFEFGQFTLFQLQFWKVIQVMIKNDMHFQLQPQVRGFETIYSLMPSLLVDVLFFFK